MALYTVDSHGNVVWLDRRRGAQVTEPEAVACPVERKSVRVRRYLVEGGCVVWLDGPRKGDD